jgi:Xaa-Pro aminopeptidase
LTGYVRISARLTAVLVGIETGSSLCGPIPRVRCSRIGTSSRRPHPLETGMVLAVEPGAYRPGRHGVRVEDMFVVGEHGGVRLTG